MKIVDLSNCGNSELNGTYVGHSGDKEGITFSGDNWMVKYPRTRALCDTSYLSEYLGSHIYSILGYDVHEVNIAYYKNRVVSMCRDITGQSLHLATIESVKNTDSDRISYLLDRDFNSSSLVDIDDTFLHFKYNTVLSTIPKIKNRFWDQVIVDGFLGNTGRTYTDWGVLRDRDGYKLAPIFSNGHAFFPEMSDEQIESQLTLKDKISIDSIDFLTNYSREDMTLSFCDLLDIDDIDLKLSIIKNVQAIQNNMSKIEVLIDDVPEEYFGKIICSAARKEYYKLILKKRLELILLPAYDSIIIDIESIMRKRIETDLHNYAFNCKISVLEAIEKLSSSLPLSYDKQELPKAVQAWITLQIEQGEKPTKDDVKMLCNTFKNGILL